MKYGRELLTELQEQLEKEKLKKNQMEDSIIRGEIEPSDCCISRWASDINIQLLEEKINILENGGMAEFKELQYLDGTPVPGYWCNTKFGRKFKTTKGEWVNPYVKPKTLEKKGYKLGTVMKPAWAEIADRGGSMANCYIKVIPSDVNYWTGECCNEKFDYRCSR